MLSREEGGVKVQELVSEQTWTTYRQVVRISAAGGQPPVPRYFR